MYIGIDESSGLVFEGNSTYGARMLLPLPLLTPAKFVSDKSFVPAVVSRFGITECLFREDAFDPITRIRRGRFYKQKTGVQPESWNVMVAPPVSACAGLNNQRVYSFESVDSSHLGAESDGQQVVILGAGEAFSIWTIVSKETVHTGEVLVSLKMRQNFGVLPEIVWSQVPDRGGGG